MKYSLTYASVITFAVGYLFKLAGVPFVEGDLETTISFITSLVGVIGALYGRFRKGDITVLGKMK
ncbi:MAG: hypothetical protein K9M15_02780 [Candidatus Marinimicrobia bacterium]|nr:hypothetical protein [Candidatus Neomarinimicrobiota bacterium]